MLNVIMNEKVVASVRNRSGYRSSNNPRNVTIAKLDIRKPSFRFF